MSKNKGGGGREVRKPKADKPKNNMSQPSTKGMSELVSPAKVNPKRGATR